MISTAFGIGAKRAQNIGREADILLGVWENTTK